MLPGEADAAEDLDALLGAVRGRLERRRRRRCARSGGDRAAVVGVAPSASSLQAAAASQATAAHCSTATSMSASACLTAWNWPIGRPNCTRTLAYSDAVSQAPAGDARALGRGQRQGQAAHVVVGHHDLLGRGTTRPPSPAMSSCPTGAGAVERRRAPRTGPRRRAPSRSSRNQPMPAPSVVERARGPGGPSAARAPGAPCRRRTSAAVGRPLARRSGCAPRATAAVMEPSASPRQPARRDAPPARAVRGPGRPRRAPSAAAGPGKSACPSSSSTTASSASVKPWPPCVLGQVEAEPALGGHLLPGRPAARPTRRRLGHGPRARSAGSASGPSAARWGAATRGPR